MAGGTKGMLGNQLIKTGIGFGGQPPAPAQASAPMGSATPQATPNVYAPSFQSPQATQPLAPAMMSPAQQFQRAGLQALMANMMAQYQNVPGASVMQRQAPMQMPRYVSPATAYRPNMAPAQSSLNRVAVSVAEQQRRDAQAELDKLKSENEQLRGQVRPTDSNAYSGG